MKKNILQFTAIISLIIFISAGLQLNAVHAESFKSNNLYIKLASDTGSAGVYGNESDSQEIPDKFILLQNYPNPFNPTTTIKYSLPEADHISIIVYNSLGNKIETLVNETQSAGFHKTAFNGEDLSSGVYFAQLKAGRVVKVIKMILVK